MKETSKTQNSDAVESLESHEEPTRFSPFSRPTETAQQVLRLAIRYGMVIALIVLVIAAQASYSRFLTLVNIQNVITQNASTAIVAIGATYVIIGGGFDLSVAGIFGLGSVLFAGLVVMSGYPVWLALVVALAAGTLCGLVNGFVVTKLKVNTFVATLGTAAVFTGIAALYSGSTPISVFNVDGFKTLGSGGIFGVDYLLIIIVLLFLIFGFVLSRTVYGKSLYASGGNREAARLAGTNVDLIQTISFGISGLLAAFAGTALTSTIATGQFNQGSTVALDSIAAVVVGGTSLYGGEGAMWRTAVGVGILATMNNLFSSLSVQAPAQNIIKGLVLVAAVAFEELVRSQTK